MDGIALRNWPKGLGALLALLLGLSLLSFHLQDPTFSNLRLPGTGIGNWLGLPGALLGGSLLELLGIAAFAAPMLVLNWACVTRERPPLHRYLGWSAALLLALAGLHGIAVPLGDPGLLGPGLVGGALREWAAATTGPWAGAALLAYLGGVAATRVVYAPLVRLALRDARLFGAWFLRSGWRRSGEGWLALQGRAGRLQRVALATTDGLQRGARRKGHDLLRAVLGGPRDLLAWLVDWRTPSLGRIKARSAARTAHPSAAPAARGAEAAADGFDQWLRGEQPPAAAAEAIAATAPMPAQKSHPRPAWARDLSWATAPDAEPARSAVSQAEPRTEAAPGAADPAEPAAAPVAPGATDYDFERPEAEAAWRERFQRYARNLDLDWEEQLWKRKEEDLFADSDEPAADSDP